MSNIYQVSDDSGKLVDLFDDPYAKEYIRGHIDGYSELLKIMEGKNERAT